MAGNVTEKLREFSRQMRWRTQEPLKPRARDRSLNGKERVKARRAANKESRTDGD